MRRHRINQFLGVFFSFIISLACTISFTPKNEQKESPVDILDMSDAVSDPDTGRLISFSVDDDGQVTFWSEEDPDLEPLFSRVVSKERGVLEWKGERFDGVGELTDNQSQILSELFASPYGQELALIGLENACRYDNDLTAQQLAALLYPWQMHLKYSPIDRAEEAQRMWDASGCADTISQQSAEVDQDTPILIYSNAASIPVVFGYFPFDGEGSYELENITSIIDNPSSNIMLMAFQADEPVNQASADAPLDQFGPCGSKCRGACGADCTTNNCEVEEILVCARNDKGEYTGYLVYADRYLCGVHPGCIEHDACYDECNAKYGCDTWKASICRHSGLAELGPPGCDTKASQQYGKIQCINWARGYPGPLGTFDTYKVFDYIRKQSQVSYFKPDECKEGEPTQFTITGDFMYLDFDYLRAFGEDRFDCTPGKGSLSFTIWNKGASGGDEYGIVDTAGSIMPEWSHLKRETTGTSGTSATKTCNVYDNHKEMEGAVTFSGGPNGVIRYDGIEIGKFIDGKMFVFSGDPFSGNQIAVPDPSVFDGLE